MSATSFVEGFARGIGGRLPDYIKAIANAREAQAIEAQHRLDRFLGRRVRAKVGESWAKVEGRTVAVATWIETECIGWTAPSSGDALMLAGVIGDVRAADCEIVER